MNIFSKVTVVPFTDGSKDPVVSHLVFIRTSGCCYDNNIYISTCSICSFHNNIDQVIKALTMRPKCSKNN